MLSVILQFGAIRLICNHLQVHPSNPNGITKKCKIGVQKRNT